MKVVGRSSAASGIARVTRAPPSWKYVWGATRLAYAASGSGVLVYHIAGLGSVRALTDGTGTIVQTYRTDAFGNPDTTDTQGTVTQRFQYAGDERDENGLIFLRARYYNPSIGRFMSRDPLLNSGLGITGWNRFAYVGDNPVKFTDPSGLCSNQACGNSSTANGHSLTRIGRTRIWTTIPDRPGYQQAAKWLVPIVSSLKHLDRTVVQKQLSRARSSWT